MTWNKHAVVLVALASIIALGLSLAGCSRGKQSATPSPERRAPSQPAPRPEAGQASLPWEGDGRFIAAKRDAGTRVLMARFEATLPDPILFERENIALAADYVCGTVVKPGQVFSLNSGIGPRSTARGFRMGPMYRGNRLSSTTGGGICKVASVMYNVAVLANLEVLERHPHSMTVPYVPPGQDATISSGTKDLKVRNNTSFPVLIWMRNYRGTLYAGLYGRVQPPKVTWIQETLDRTRSWTEYARDPNLPKGTTKVEYGGSDGVTVHSRVKVVRTDGSAAVKDFGTYTYLPGPRIVVSGA